MYPMTDPTPGGLAALSALAAAAAFQKADDDWQREIVVELGESRAAEARYRPSGRGQEGTALRRAYEAREAAREAWEAARLAATPSTGETP